MATTLSHLTNAHGALGDPGTKKDMLQRALRIVEAHYREDHYQVAIALSNLASPITLSNLANAHGVLGDPGTQKDLLQRALRILEAHYGGDHYHHLRMRGPAVPPKVIAFWAWATYVTDGSIASGGPSALRMLWT